MNARELTQRIAACASEDQRRVLTRFFKTSEGQYGHGDTFLGVRVPQVRAVVKEAAHSATVSDIEDCIKSQYHEVRLCGFLLLTNRMKKALPTRRGDSRAKAAERQAIADTYLRLARHANNWDLVDLSAPDILGQWLLHPAPDGTHPSRDILDRLAAGECFWEQRIAIVATLALIRNRQFDDTLRVARTLLSHPHDLIHKAVGWMLREVGKRDLDTMLDFLAENYSELPRTSLRYAIEKLPEPERRQWLQGPQR